MKTTHFGGGFVGFVGGREVGRRAVVDLSRSREVGRSQEVGSRLAV